MRARLLIVLLAVVAAACGSADASGPPEINLGRDICMECGMVIDDDRFAAAYRLDDGTEKIFDDIGGLIIYGREASELDEATIWVADYKTREMLDAATAFFVPTIAVASPMGHGLLAFGDEASASEMAASMDGEVLGWDVVRELPVMDGLVGHHHHEEMDEHDEHDEHAEEMDEHDEHEMDEHEMADDG